MIPLDVYTTYRCRDCGAKITLHVPVYHTKDYSVAQEYALNVNDARRELVVFEKYHSEHVYLFGSTLMPIGSF